MWPKVVLITCASILVLGVSSDGKKMYQSKSTPTVATSSNSFAFALYKTFQEDGNLMFSPWSIAFALGMVMLGAEGTTLQEMRKAMFFEQTNPENIHYGFKQLREHLLRHGTAYEMNMFSTILVQEKLNISPVYKLKLQRYYDADIHDVDFTELGQLVTDWINVWTSLKTGGKIKQIVTTVPAPDTVMLLLTANYFKGMWEDTFDGNATKSATFHNSDGSNSRTDMMHATRNMTIYTGDKLPLDAVDLPMKGDISFLLIKPEKPSQMSTLQKNISAEFLEEIYGDMSEEAVELGLPKFKASSRVELQPSLEMLGMQSLFSPTNAQLTGISSSGGLSVQEVIHKAALEIDENGAIATSITVISIVSRHKAYKLHFDSPFIFLIRDTKSGVILFMGRITSL